MIRLAIGICLLAALIWFGGVYKLGDKTFAGHMDEVFRSPIVQQKLEALHKGFDSKLDDFAVERSQKDSVKRRVQARVVPSAKPSPMTVAPPTPPPPATPSEPVDVRPQKAKKAPPRDSLTDDDRDELKKLLDDKLQK